MKDTKFREPSMNSVSRTNKKKSTPRNRENLKEKEEKTDVTSKGNSRGLGGGNITLIEATIQLTADFSRVMGASVQWNGIFHVLKENNCLSRNSIPRENFFEV